MKLERLGPYKLEKILGRGGMGAVYVGLNDETGERAAVKVLNPVLADDLNFRERFKAEVETLKKLLHPNIVQLFGFGEQDDFLFYVMELVEGRSLQDELVAGRRFQWREVARIGIDVAHALKHAHDRGVIHRDLKPANLLIDPQEHVKLTDFGIAKLYGGASFTAEGGVLGTADYMAPEQAEGKPVTSRCDLYSLGSVLYALLTGRPPFAGKSLPEVIQGLRFERPLPLHRLNPDVPAEFEEIVAQLLEKDPQQRIPTALALANRLKAMVHALSMETRVDLGDVSDEAPAAEQTGAAPRAQGVTAPMPIQTEFSTAARPTMPLPAAGDEVAGPQATAEISVVPAPGRSAVTQARSATRADEVQPASSASESGTTRSVFTTVTEDELRASHVARTDEEHPLLAWLKIGGLVLAVLLLVGAFGYYATRQPSADDLYARVKAAEDAEQLEDAEPQIARFLANYPSDERAEELRQLQQESELLRLQRRLARRARSGAAGSQSPIEQIYLKAERVSVSDPVEALQRFQALVDVYAGSALLGKDAADQQANEQYLELARQQIDRLRTVAQDHIASQRKLLSALLNEAASLSATDAERADRMRRGLVKLYGDEPWAAELLAPIRDDLPLEDVSP